MLFRSKPFPITGIREQQLKECINDLIESKVLEKGDSAYVSPVFFVSKKFGDNKEALGGRLVIDYRRLNQLIKPCHFPLSTVKNFYDNCAKFKYFTLIDIKNAFNSIGLTERAKERTAIITTFGTYRFTRVPFGLKTAPSGFCLALSICLKPVEEYVVSYMDDLIVGADSCEEMTKRVIQVFELLNKHNLNIQIGKVRRSEEHTS